MTASAKQIFTIIFCALLFGAQSITAQTTVFNYQGKLTDSGAAQSIYQMEFRLFGSPGGADQIGDTISNPNVAVNQSVFAVSLDFGAAAFDGADRYLQISVRRNADELHHAQPARENRVVAVFRSHTKRGASRSFAGFKQTRGSGRERIRYDGNHRRHIH